MASTLEKTIRSAAEKIAQMLEENATLTIRTYITPVGEGAAAGSEPRVLIAETVIGLDGDYTTVIPVQRAESGLLERDEDLLASHQQHVLAAIDYRNKSLNALLDIIKK